MANADIKQAAKKANVKLWQIAKAYGIRDTEFSKYLREELSDDSKNEILDTIQKLKVN